MVAPTLSGTLTLFGLFVGWIALSLIAVVYGEWFRFALEERHPQIWKSLGSPGPVNRLDSSYGKINGFLWMGRYRRVGDPELTRLGDRARLSLLVVFLCLIVGVICNFELPWHR